MRGGSVRPTGVARALTSLRGGGSGVAAQASAGTGIDNNCVDAYLALKSKRKFKFVTYKIEGDTVVVDTEGAPSATYDDFVAALPENDCRYAVYDHEWKQDDGVKKNKIAFMSWSPDTSKIRTKMVYASSKDSFKRTLDGIQVEIQATDYSEADLSVMNSKCGN